MKETNELVKIIVEAAEERKAENCVVLNMEQLTPITDRYVICHGNNERQVQAIARAIKNAVEENGLDIQRMEGFEQARWILIDAKDVVCHVFHKDERTYYNLEKLWGDADVVGDNK